MIKIAFLITDFSLGRGGERVSLNLANELAAQYRVRIISLYQSRPDPFFKVDEKVSVKVLTGKPSDQPAPFITKKIAERRRLKEHFREEQYQVIVGVASYPSILLGLYGPSESIRIAWEHSNYDALPYGWRLIRTFCYRRMNALVCLTEDDKKRFNNNPSDICVIANALSFVTEKKSALTGKRIFAAGAFEYEKGFDLLIKAFAKIQKECVGWTLEIFGEGSQKAILEKEIQSCGSGSRILLRAPSRNIRSEMLESTICVVPSRREGFGMILIEAMECGLACISFDCPTGPRNIITPGENGLLVPPENPDLLAASILKLVKDRSKIQELAGNGIRSVQRFSKNTIAAKWTRLIDKLVLG